MISASAGIVAIVDDDASLLKALERALQAYGYRVLAFPSAAAYLAADWTDIACVVIDIDLGGQRSGLDLGIELAATGHRPAVVYMTGSIDPKVQARAMALGCAAFLEKPFFTERLVAAIINLEPT